MHRPTLDDVFLAVTAVTESSSEPLGSPGRRCAAPPPGTAGATRPGRWASEFAWAISDAGVLTRRNLLHTVRLRELWPFMFLQPLVFVLLFSLVFGGAIQLPGGGSYREFLMAGVFAQAVSFSTFPTTVAMAYDLHLGLMDRLRTLPIHPAAIFVGRTVGDIAPDVDLADGDGVVRPRRRLADQRRTRCARWPASRCCCCSGSR